MTAAKPTFCYYKGRRYEMKENGLPKGFGLYWFDPRPKSEKEADPDHGNRKKYIYTKLGGRGISCQTRDWKEAIDFVEEYRREDENQNKPVGKLIINDLLDNYIKYLEHKNEARGEYRPKTAEITRVVAKK